MCGIAGIFDPAGGAAPPEAWRGVREDIGRMTATLRPRGPDAEGFFVAAGVALGHARLRVIDLDPRADQPLAGCERGQDEERVRVVFNGEIYGHERLRGELEALGHRFRSRSDAEVLVHGYEQWGEALLDRIDGMFAFAIWDGAARRLLLARDRLGKKPLYLAELPVDAARTTTATTRRWAFASELKALFTLPALDRSIDVTALGRYLIADCVPAPRTIVNGARKLDAAECLTLDAGTTGPASPRRYWALPFSATPDARDQARDDERAARDVRRALAEAVDRRLTADVPLGIFLSGGIDSSAVAALAVRSDRAPRPLDTFALGFDGDDFDETPAARRVATILGTRHHERHVSEGDLVAALPGVLSFLDEPLADPSIVPTHLLAAFAREHVTVALSGDGGDELLAGYPTFVAERVARGTWDLVPAAWRRRLAHVARRLPATPGYMSAGFVAAQFLGAADTRGPRRHQRWMAAFLPEELPDLLAPDLARALPADPLADLDAHAACSSARDPWDVLLDHYVHFYLGGDLNPKVDRASGAVGLEVRCPFEDTALVNVACALAPHQRLRGFTGKHVLRRALADVLPADILDRRKHGFAVPVARLLRGALREDLRAALDPARLARQGIFNPAVVTRLLDEHLAHTRDHRKRLWSLFVFQRWLDRWGASA